MIHSVTATSKQKLINFLKKYKLVPIKPIIIYKNAYRATIIDKKEFKSFSTVVLDDNIHLIIGYK